MYVTGIKFRLENGWNSKQMITEGEAAIPLETTRRAFGNQEKSKQRSAINKSSNFRDCIRDRTLIESGQ